MRYINNSPDHPLNQGEICAQCSSGIMKQYSPGLFFSLLERKPGSERGEEQFEEIGKPHLQNIAAARETGTCPVVTGRHGPIAPARLGGVARKVVGVADLPVLVCFKPAASEPSPP